MPGVKRQQHAFDRIHQQPQPEKTRRRTSRPTPRRNRVQQRQLEEIRQRESFTTEEIRQQESFLATVVGVALGFGLGSLLFGDDCDLDI